MITSVLAMLVLGAEVSDAPAQRIRTSGAYVERIAPGSPAEVARLLPGDVIVQIGETPVTDHATYRTAVAALAAGSQVSVAIRRYGRALTLGVTPVGADALYAKTPSCEPDAIAAELGAAGVSERRREYDMQEVHGARALDLAETCAAVQHVATGETLARVAAAFEAIGTGAALQSDREGAAHLLADAWVVERLIATSPGMTGDERRAATAKALSLERREPGVSTENDPAIVDGLTYAGAALGEHAFTVTNTWTTSGDNYTRLLHLRVRIETARDAMLFANFFRVTAPSPDTGDEAFFAIEGPSHPGPRIEVPGLRGVKAEIAPNEDFGVLRHVFAVADTPQSYVLTFVVSDVNADLSNVAATLAYLPQ